MEKKNDNRAAKSFVDLPQEFPDPKSFICECFIWKT